MDLLYINTTEQVANRLIKALPNQPFIQFRRILGLKEPLRYQSNNRTLTDSGPDKLRVTNGTRRATMQGSRYIGEPQYRGAENFFYPNGYNVKGLVNRFVNRFMVCF